MKIVYYVAASFDSPHYSVRGRTRAAVVAGLKAYGFTSTGRTTDGMFKGQQNFAPIRKVVVNYRDDFDLLVKALDGTVYEG